jgi:hypothetical protein
VITEDRLDQLEQPARDSKPGRPVRSGSVVRGSVVALAIVTMVVVILVARGWRPMGSHSSAAATKGMPTSAAIEAAYGVRFTGVDVTAGGGMIEIRYQVLDADKVEAVHGGEDAPVLVGPDGHVYSDPGIAGHTHIGRVANAGSSDVILLANARGAIRAGSVVTIRIGTLELHGVRVA